MLNWDLYGELLQDVFEMRESLVVDEVNNPISKLDPEMFTDDKKDNGIISFSELKIQVFT